MKLTLEISVLNKTTLTLLIIYQIKKDNDERKDKYVEILIMEEKKLGK